MYPAYVACLCRSSAAAHLAFCKWRHPELGEILDGGFSMVSQVQGSSFTDFLITFAYLHRFSWLGCRQYCHVHFLGITVFFSGTRSIFLLQTFCSPLQQDMRELHGSFCALKISMVGKAGTLEKHLSLSIQMQTAHYHGIRRNNIAVIGGINVLRKIDCRVAAAMIFALISVCIFDPIKWQDHQPVVDAFSLWKEADKQFRSISQTSHLLTPSLHLQHNGKKVCWISVDHVNFGSRQILMRCRTVFGTGAK